MGQPSCEWMDRLRWLVTTLIVAPDKYIALELFVIATRALTEEEEKNHKKIKLTEQFHPKINIHYVNKLLLRVQHDKSGTNDGISKGTH